jgi:predicted nucleic acid-binding protein
LGHDVTGDGLVNEQDQQMVTNCVSNASTCTDLYRLRSDLNRDGVVNAIDVQIAANAISQFGGSGSNWTPTGANLYNKNTGNVGIGTTNPTAKLHVQGSLFATGLAINGKVAIVDGTQGLNKILASDATGLATWKTAAELGLSGGGGLTPGGLGFDVNGDGRVNEQDQQMVTNCVSNASTCTDLYRLRSDLNRDGVVNAIDVQIAANAISQFGGATYTAGTGLNLSGTTFSAKTTSALWNANQIQSRSVSSVAPTSGQVLKWNGSAWAPAADDTGTTDGEFTFSQRKVVSMDSLGTVACPDSSWFAISGGFNIAAGGGGHPTTDPKNYLRSVISMPGPYNNYSWYCAATADSYPNGSGAVDGRCYVLCI